MQMFLILLFLLKFLIHKEFKTIIVELSVEEDANEISGVPEWVALTIEFSIENIDV